MDRLARDLDRMLLLDMGFLDGAATIGTAARPRGFVDFVDGLRRLAMGFGARVLAGLAARLLGLGLGWSFRDRCRLAFAGVQGLRKRGFEFGDTSAKRFTAEIS